MIPLRLELTNFLAYRNPAPLDFNGIHTAVLIGENGAGKSSLIDAITWALWGRARIKDTEQLVHQGQTEMRVEFTFALNDQAYRVIRAKRIGRSAVSLLDLQAQSAGRWHSLAAATIPKTQEKINQLLRLTYETFINSACLIQGKADEFTGKQPAQRKQVLADILGLQEWERSEERAKEKIKQCDTRLTALDAVLAEIEAELGRRADYERGLSEAQKQAAEAEERLRQAEAAWAQIEAARQTLTALTRQMEDLERRLRQAEGELAALKAGLRQAQTRADAVSIARQLEAAQHRLAELEALENELEQLTAAHQANAEHAAQLNGQNEALKVEADGLKKRLETLQTAAEARCPVCGQPLAESERARLLAELDAEVETRRGRYRDNQTQLKCLAEAMAAQEKTLSRLRTDLREKPLLIKQTAELQTALIGANEAKNRIAELNERRQSWLETLAADRAQRQELHAEVEKCAAIVGDTASKQIELDHLRREDALAKARLGAAQQSLAALENLGQQRVAKLAGRRQLAETRGLYEELREACSKNGVPAMIIEAAVPEIESAANSLLARMTGGRLHLRFNTQRETQAGETRETLELQIADELGTRPYELYSGGETFRVNFAVRLALSQLLAHRAGTRLETLIIDEGFGALDAIGRERLVEAIHAAQADFRLILVITHLEELKDAFPTRIEITKGPRGSEIAVV